MARNPIQFGKGLSLSEFQERFGTEEQCRQAVVAWRWPNGFVCPACGGRDHAIVGVTAFTLAHSLTLALAAFDVVQLPGRMIEVAIALSVAWVAAENLWWRDSITQRIAVAFGFGAVHGLGFSEVLKEAGLTGGPLAWSLLGFNLGVETGQVVAVLAVLPLLIMLRSSPWKMRASNGLSAAVLVFALYLARSRLIG